MEFHGLPYIMDHNRLSSIVPDNFYRSTVDRLPFKCINPSLKLCHTDMVLDGPSDLN